MAIGRTFKEALQKALRGIERANPETLFGIFGDAQWRNKERLSDALLRDLVEHFSRISLGNQAGQADILGQSYEYLIKKFADATTRKAGEFYTPRLIVRLMVNIRHRSGTSWSRTSSLTLPGAIQLHSP
jgi:type I restriction enzyme M protein